MNYSMDRAVRFTVEKPANPQKTWVCFGPSKPMVAGSNPAGIANIFNDLQRVFALYFFPDLSRLQTVYRTCFRHVLKAGEE